MDINGIFTRLKQAVTSFADDSNAWQQQVVVPLPSPDIQPDLDALKEVDKNLKSIVMDPAPTSITGLNDVFTSVDTQLTTARDIYAYSSGISQTPAAKTKEKKARQSLRNLAKTVNEIRPQIFSALQIKSNLFLEIMKSQIEKPIVIKGVTFSTITQGNFDLTQRLFKRKSFTSVERKNFNFDNDENIQNLMDSWETVIAFFVDTNKSTTASKDPTVIALVKANAESRFFIMHGLFEVLYDQLESNRRTTDILSSAI